MTHSRSSYGLPREVLKWIQSLDLAYSVKSPKRAFSNGFLVAEIFSRYDRSIPMHSYDNGASSKVRLDNWKQITKHFRKHEIPYDEELVQRIMYGSDEEDVIEFLKSIYTILTRRKVAPPPKMKALPRVPPFAKKTANLKLRQVDERNLQLGKHDTTERTEDLKATLEQHNQDTRQERNEIGNARYFEESKVAPES